MSDKEDVIKGLEKCKRHECDDCAEKGASQAPWDCPVYDDFVDSAIALLKEQEEKEEKEMHPCENCQEFECDGCPYADD